MIDALKTPSFGELPTCFNSKIVTYYSKFLKITSLCSCVSKMLIIVSSPQTSNNESENRSHSFKKDPFAQFSII